MSAPPPPPGPPPPPSVNFTPPPASKGRNDLLADIRNGNKGKLKKVPASQKKDSSAVDVKKTSGGSSSSSSSGGSSGGSSQGGGGFVSTGNAMMDEIMRKRANLGKGSASSPKTSESPSSPFPSSSPALKKTTSFKSNSDSSASSTPSWKTSTSSDTSSTPSWKTNNSTSSITPSWKTSNSTSSDTSSTPSASASWKSKSNSSTSTTPSWKTSNNTSSEASSTPSWKTNNSSSTTPSWKTSNSTSSDTSSTPSWKTNNSSTSTAKPSWKSNDSTTSTEVRSTPFSQAQSTQAPPDQLEQSDISAVARALKCTTGDLLAVAPVRLFVSSSDSWEYTGVCGVAAVLMDNSANALYIHVVDLSTKTVAFSQEVYVNFEYNVLTPYLHAFEGDDAVYGLNFAESFDASDFEREATKKTSSSAKPPPPSTSSKPSSSFSSKPPPPSVSAKPTSFGAKVSSGNSSPATNSGSNAFGAKVNLFNNLYGGSSPMTPREQARRQVEQLEFDPNGGFVEIPHAWKAIFEKAGVTEAELKDAKTAQFILETILKNDPNAFN